MKLKQLMNVIYDDHYNFDLGVLKYLHPFEGAKFRDIFEAIKPSSKINIISPKQPVEMVVINEFLSSIMQHRVRNKNGILKALEIPNIPFLSFNFIDKKILTPMRWGVAGTQFGSEQVLQKGGVYWNLSGGYHHAMHQNMEGFCIYNDVGIVYDQLIKNKLLSANDKVLIIDTDAHHGNGNAYTFMDNSNVTILDVYNSDIYPTSKFTRDRVNISVPLKSGTQGDQYLEVFKKSLEKITNEYRLAYVIAGTDTLTSDKLGKLKLTVQDICNREYLTLQTLKNLRIPTVILGGGGYSKESAKAVTEAIIYCENF